jgi:sugar phosphate isomerase/epimerase
MRISVRDEMAPVAAGKTVFETLRQLEIAAIEICVQLDGSMPNLESKLGTAGSILNEPTATELGRRLKDEGISVSALLLGTDFSSEHPDQQVDWAVRSTRAAEILGAPAVRIDTATANRTLTHDQVRQNFINRIGQVLQRTAGSHVGYGIENHGHISNNPQFLDGVFAAVGDKRLGMTLDTGNFYWYGMPLRELYRTLEHFAPRAKHTHVKNINYPAEMVEQRREVGYEYGKYCCPLDEGNIDIGRVVKILKQAGYQADLCIENESLGKYPENQRMGIIQRDAAALKRGLAGN